MAESEPSTLTVDLAIPSNRVVIERPTEILCVGPDGEVLQLIADRLRNSALGWRKLPSFDEAAKRYGIDTILS